MLARQVGNKAMLKFLEYRDHEEPLNSFKQGNGTFKFVIRNITPLRV